MRSDREPRRVGLHAIQRLLGFHGRIACMSRRSDGAHVPYDGKWAEHVSLAVVAALDRHESHVQAALGALQAATVLSLCILCTTTPITGR